mmetsp:Transcript_107707/g.334864  ORF Transcript_107707/g.334864 Transcript_107707/m.334864 type:complete len:201 (+) Transcript_107707:131-733(+)
MPRKRTLERALSSKRSGELVPLWRNAALLAPARYSFAEVRPSISDVRAFARFSKALMIQSQSAVMLSLYSTSSLSSPSLNSSVFFSSPFSSVLSAIAVSKLSFFASSSACISSAAFRAFSYESCAFTSSFIAFLISSPRSSMTMVINDTMPLDSPLRDPLSENSASGAWYLSTSNSGSRATKDEIFLSFCKFPMSTPFFL